MLTAALHPRRRPDRGARPRIRARARRAHRRDRRGQVDPARRARAGARRARRQRPGPRRPGAGGRSRVAFELPRRPCSARPARRERASRPSRASRCVIRRIAQGRRRQPRLRQRPGGARPALLRELGAVLVEIHGQHDDRGLLNPAATAPCSTASAASTPARSARAWARCRELERELDAARARRSTRPTRDREWLDHRGRRARRARRRGGRGGSASPTCARDMQAGGAARGRSRRARRAARRLGRRAVAAAPGGAAARPDRRRASAARRGAGRARPRGDRGGRGRGTHRRRAPRRWPSTRPSSRRPRRGCSRSARWPASTASRPTRLPALRDELQAQARARSRQASERIAALEAALAEARDAPIDARPTALTRGAPRGRGAARRGGGRRAGAAEARRGALPHRDRRRRARAGGRRPGRVRGLDQPRRAVRAADQDRRGGELSRFILALKVALAEAGGGGDDDLRRDRPRRRRRGRQRDRRAAAPAGARRRRCWSSPTARRSRRARAHHFLIEKSHDGIVTRTSVRKLDAEPSAARRSRGCCRARRSPTRRGRRRRGCWRRHERDADDRAEFDGADARHELVSDGSGDARPAVILFPTVMGDHRPRARLCRAAGRAGLYGVLADLYGRRFTRDQREDAMAAMTALRARPRGACATGLLACSATRSQQDEIDDERVAAIGFCFGGQNRARPRALGRRHRRRGELPRPVRPARACRRSRSRPRSPPSTAGTIRWSRPRRSSRSASELTEAGCRLADPRLRPCRPRLHQPRRDRRDRRGSSSTSAAARRAWAGCDAFLAECFAMTSLCRDAARGERVGDGQIADGRIEGDRRGVRLRQRPHLHRQRQSAVRQRSRRGRSASSGSTAKVEAFFGKPVPVFVRSAAEMAGGRGGQSVRRRQAEPGDGALHRRGADRRRCSTRRATSPASAWRSARA